MKGNSCVAFFLYLCRELSSPYMKQVNKQSPSARHISIKHANHNNLKDISIDIPRNKLTIITGLSGSGKSTLAFDTLYAEGQRRFVESLSAYARQFLERMGKPDVESITGLPPAISIEQKSPPRNTRSTVGTATEIYDYIRALYARLGVTVCKKCGKTVKQETPDHIVQEILSNEENEKIFILFSLKPSITDVISELKRLQKLGFNRIVTGSSNEIIDINEADIPKKIHANQIGVLVDRVVVNHDRENITRLIDSIELALNAGYGRITVRNITKNTETKYSNIFECANCDIVYEVPEPRLFAFNNPKGACPYCQGLGTGLNYSESLIVPDKTLTLARNAIHPFRTPSTAAMLKSMFEMCENNHIPLHKPYKELSEQDRDWIWNGKDDYVGVLGYFRHLEEKNYKIQNKIIAAKYRELSECIHCKGSRIRTAAQCVYVHGKNIPEIINMPIDDLCPFIANLPMNDYEKKITEPIMVELVSRLKMLLDIGVGYLTVARPTQTLSGGEFQRINLAKALGSSLVGTLYILDEPSIGMHPRDTGRLIGILHKLRNLGNTIIVVEHDMEIISTADFVIDMGIGAGINGGSVVYSGAFDGLLENKDSLTAKYFTGELQINMPARRNTARNPKITITDICENNLKIPRVEIPLHCMAVVTGVSGSGKSTLVHNVLYPAITSAQGIPIADKKVGKFGTIDGYGHIAAIHMVDQTPIGRMSRSTPATYLKIFDYIRETFAQTQAARQLGLKPGFFSFNVPGGGRCETCEGEGYVDVDMQFLPDVRVLCEECNGKRYKKDALNILFRGKSIADVLDMTADEALFFFDGISKVTGKLSILNKIGLGYIKLGQSSSVISGGEAQRIKLAAHIDAANSTNNLYIFDEPTTGLHTHDIAKLLSAIQLLVDSGSSALIIEHNLHIIAAADHIIDLGPEAGNSGGMLTGCGSPAHIATLNTHTGIAIKNFLAGLAR